MSNPIPELPWADLNALFDSLASQKPTYSLPLGNPLRKQLARSEWYERHRAQRILAKPPRFALPNSRLE